MGVDSKGELGMSPAERTDVVDSLNLIRIMPAEGARMGEISWMFEVSEVKPGPVSSLLGNEASIDSGGSSDARRG